MPKCLECNEIVDPIHAIEYPAHTIVVLNKDPITRRYFERSIENYRKYGFQPRPPQTNEYPRRGTRRGEALSYERKEDHLEEDTISEPEEQAGSSWWITISAVAVAIGIGIAILKSRPQTGENGQLH